MASIDLFGAAFFKELEEDALAAVGVSLSRNKKIVTARTIKSVRAVTIFKNNGVDIEVYGGEGMPFIVTDKPANTKYPMDFKGTVTGKSGKPKKVFELKPHLKDWKAIKDSDGSDSDGSDFALARAIAENPRKATDIATEAIVYLNKTITPKVLNAFRASLAVEILGSFEDRQNKK